MKQAFLEGYRSAARGRFPARIPLYIAVGLMRLAALPFRFREADWLAQTEAILERAGAVEFREREESTNVIVGHRS